MTLRKLGYAIFFGMMLSASAMAGFEYEGERNAFNRFQGHGKFTSSLGVVYEGNWEDGRRDGQGIETKPNGERYEGHWSNNQESGKGKKTWPNGDVYNGQWQAGKMDGQGTIVHASGDRYSGNFVANQPDGSGTLISANGDKYEGQWKAGLRSGLFKITRKDGSVVQADWKDGKAPGLAIVEQKDGVKYTGPVLNGMVPNGKGSCFETGQIRPCEYKDGKRVVVVAQPKAEPRPKIAPVVADTAAVVAVAKVEAAVPIEPPKPKDPRTLRGVRSDGTQFFFHYNWGGGGFSDNLASLKVEKGAVKVEKGPAKDEWMQVVAKSGDLEIRMRVDKYEGAGNYELKYFKATVDKKGEVSCWTLADEPGKLVVFKDENNMLIGTFSFTGYPNGNRGADRRQLTEGEFAIRY